MSVGRSASQIDAIIDDVKDKLRGLLLTRLDPAKFADLRASSRTLLDYDAVSHTAVLGQPLPSNGAGNVAIVMAELLTYRWGARRRARSCLTGKAQRIYRRWRFRIMEIVGEDRRHSEDAGSHRRRGHGCGPDRCRRRPRRGCGDRVAHFSRLRSREPRNDSFARWPCRCAPGVTMVNIDNGYGAACAALRVINASRPVSNSAASLTPPVAPNLSGKRSGDRLGFSMTAPGRRSANCRSHNPGRNVASSSERQTNIRSACVSAI